MNNDVPNKPLLSICCITYNHEKYIKKALESFLEQATDFTFEILIGDDASLDKTQEILTNYSDKNRNIRLFLNKENIGVNRNFTNVLRNARGKYLALCDGDDYWSDPNKLQKQVDFLRKNPEYSLTCHRYSMLEETTLKVSISKPEFDTCTILEYASELPNIQTLTVVCRNPKEEVIPEELMFMVTGSTFFIIRMAEFGKIKFLNNNMAVYRVHHNGIWSGKDIISKELMAMQNINAMISYYSRHSELVVRLKETAAKRSINTALVMLRKFNIAGTLKFFRITLDYTSPIQAINLTYRNVYERLARKIKKHDY